MGIEDEVTRQKDAVGDKLSELFDGKVDLTDTHMALKPLVDRLEGQREAQYRHVGRFAAQPDGSWKACFPSLWSADTPDRNGYVRAVFNPATSGLFSNYAAPQPPRGVHMSPASVTHVGEEQYLATGELSLRQEQGAVHLYAGYLKLHPQGEGRKGVQIQERLAGKFHDLETAYEQAFPIYARYVFNAGEDAAAVNRLFTAIGEARAGRPAPQAKSGDGSAARPSAVGSQGYPRSVGGWIKLTLTITLASAASIIALVWAVMSFGLID